MSNRRLRPLTPTLVTTMLLTAALILPLAMPAPSARAQAVDETRAQQATKMLELNAKLREIEEVVLEKDEAYQQAKAKAEAADAAVDDQEASYAKMREEHPEFSSAQSDAKTASEMVVSTRAASVQATQEAGKLSAKYSRMILVLRGAEPTLRRMDQELERQRVILKSLRSTSTTYSYRVKGNRSIDNSYAIGMQVQKIADLEKEKAELQAQFDEAKSSLDSTKSELDAAKQAASEAREAMNTATKDFALSKNKVKTLDVQLSREFKESAEYQAALKEKEETQTAEEAARLKALAPLQKDAEYASLIATRNGLEKQLSRRP